MTEKKLKTSICLVDDEVELANTFAEYLNEHYDVKCFNSAADALNAFDKNYNADILVTDIKMPNINGIEFIEKMRDKNLNTPVIVMSGFAEKNHIISALEQKAYGFLEKPFDPEKLKLLIEKTLEKFINENKQNQLLQRSLELSGSMSELLTYYRERFQKAENVIYSANLDLHSNPQEVKRFLERVKRETEIENNIENLSRLTKQLVQETAIRLDFNAPLMLTKKED